MLHLEFLSRHQEKTAILRLYNTLEPDSWNDLLIFIFRFSQK